MNETLNPVSATEVGPEVAEAPKPVARKAPPKPVAKSAAKPPKAKPTTNGKAGPKKEPGGLGKNHLLYLKALAKKPLTRKEAWKATGLKDPSTSSTYLGRTDPAVRKADEAKWGYVSLLTMGLVKWEEQDIDGKDVVRFSLTAKGKKALEDAKK